MSYFKFKDSCLKQASNVRFGGSRERNMWVRKCMAVHLDKMENRMATTDVISNASPYTGRACSVNLRDGFKKFNCVGKYDNMGKCMPCDGNFLPRGRQNRTAFNKPRVMFNRSNTAWHYPSTTVGSNYAGLRRGSRGTISEWNMGMGRAKLTSRVFTKDRNQYDWGHFV